jgi:hypothetical protein
MSDVTVEPLVQTPVTATPWILVHPYIAIGPTASAVELHCSATNLEVAADQDENKIETFCGVYPSFKAPRFTITIASAMSYGAAGLWNLLFPMAGTTQPFEIRPDTAVAAPGNPSMTGTAVVKYFDFIKGGPGEISEVDLVLAVQGMPTWVYA